jgi:hypothetical protein
MVVAFACMLASSFGCASHDADEERAVRTKKLMQGYGDLAIDSAAVKLPNIKK